MVAVAVGLYFWLRNKSDRAKLIPFMVIGAILLGLEIAKQIIGFTNPAGYRLFWIPLHVCSIFAFSIPLAAFMKQKWKATKFFWGLSLAISVMVVIVVLVAPSAMMGIQVEGIVTNNPSGTWSGTPRLNYATAIFMDWHSYIYHTVAILFLFVFIALRPYKPNWHELLVASGIFMGFMLVAGIMSRVLETNFAAFRMNNNHELFWLPVVLFVYAILAAISIMIIMYSPRLYAKIRRNKEADVPKT